ncbi:hypothetical protein H6G89_06530 [Oscillatoria sp. FACHB-1407]|uniref:hypothetical protein n=1 Tax=Oscillatoria sp. FACHB-1407 TaxID=2692847 RepID=UPI0016869246|nr:hypothetical protein [Oscillatoria sp. FACHB-1407]MBD2460695.1 hypothetical protein [Oscillatoria sp. FACHB-1407]
MNSLRCYGSFSGGLPIARFIFRLTVHGWGERSPLTLIPSTLTRLSNDMHWFL